MDIDSRIEALVPRNDSNRESDTKMSFAPAPSRERSSKKRHRKSAFKTRPYEESNEEAAMDDEELHSLLGV